MICFISLLDQKLIEKAKLLEVYTDIVNKFKSVLDDDWGNDLRFASVVFVRKMLEYLGADLTGENYIEIYPELLKRLDDA